MSAESRSQLERRIVWSADEAWKVIVHISANEVFDYVYS